ncbi:hypothetical protein PTW37_16795 (plasmid) [Arthrobacter agilis]|uniref:hypothetical protein n=1 Tax=Arthrobacter agilis TaxID=37921 RepID=UPI00236529E2|nr:hypothetical protein [Arthrobacter agilis]WDF35009.1 hypothetical protein PTW37_16795 [Arthrobacter agilis]
MGDGVTTRTRHGRGSATGSTAHEFETGFNDMVSVLNDNLGPGLTQLISGKDRQTVARWMSGKQLPKSLEVERRIRAAYQIFMFLAHDPQAPQSPHTVRAWFMGMNGQLDDMSPAEAIAENRTREAMAAARAYRAGG